MKKKHFTLVELLVSLGVFSILLVLFMQFFSSMRLVWTNTERKTVEHRDVRIAMDIISSMLGSMYYTNSNYDYLATAAETNFNSWDRVQFPFRVERNSSDARIPDNMIFATKANLDLPGTAPIRFVGLFVPVPEKNLDVLLTGSDAALSAQEGFNKLFFTVLSNAAKDCDGKDINGTNSDIYHCFWPSPKFVDPSTLASPQLVDVGKALGFLWGNLKSKLKIEFDDGLPKLPVQRTKLLDYVTDFKIVLYDKDGNITSGDVVSAMPIEIEIRISVLNKEKFEQWCTLKGGIDKEEKTGADGKIPRTYREENQTTYTRRIYIGQRWAMEEKYEKYTN